MLEPYPTPGKCFGSEPAGLFLNGDTVCAGMPMREKGITDRLVYSHYRIEA